mmetsp:Transcript_17303/g.31166  ORF Transcript_17303/g.31166 Transcript_17303/m.31166 type:complete len:522 (+) Transcript_17303:1780-3345(+)
MSSIYSRTVRSIKEALNGNLISRDANFDSALELTLQYEEELRTLLAKVDQFQSSLQGFSSFSEELFETASQMLKSSEVHHKLIEEGQGVHKNLSSLYAESAAQIAVARGPISEILEKYTTLRSLRSERNSRRMLYDHYNQKVNDLKAKTAKKKEANPYYQANTKKQARMARNDRKLKVATDEFNAITFKIQEIMDEMFESRFRFIVPLMAFLVRIEVSSMSKSGKMLRALEEWPDEIMEANAKRAAEIQKPEPEKVTDDTDSLRLRKSQPQAEPKKEEPVGRIKNEIFDTEMDEDAIVFDMDKFKVLDNKEASPQKDTQSKRAPQFEGHSEPKENPFFNYDQPTMQHASSYPLAPAERPLTKRNSDPFLTEESKDPADHGYPAKQFNTHSFFAGFDNSQPGVGVQPAMGTQPGLPDMNSFQMQQYAQMMAMYQNPELMKQMHQFMTQASPDMMSKNTSMYATSPSDSQFKFNFSNPGFNDPFAEFTQPPASQQEAKPATKNPFAQQSGPNTARGSDFFDLL